MSSDTPTPPDGAEPFSGSNDELDVETVKLDAGEVLQGTVTDIKTGEHPRTGRWERLRINDESRGVVDYFAEGEVRTAVNGDELSVGDDVWVAKDVEEETYTNDDGEEFEYFPVQLAFLE